MLRDGPDAEPELGGIRHLPELSELQRQVVEVGFAERVGPPQVGVGDGQVVEIVRAEGDLALLAG